MEAEEKQRNKLKKLLENQGVDPPVTEFIFKESTYDGDDSEFWILIKNLLTDIVKKTMDEEYRENLIDGIFTAVEVLLSEAATKIPPYNEDSSTNLADVILALTEIFRLLRNSCVNVPRIQCTISEKTDILKYTCIILTALSTHSEEQLQPPTILCLQVGVQFIGNLVVANQESQAIVWEKCSDLLLHLLTFTHHKIVDHTSMVIYNIFLGCPEFKPVLENHMNQLVQLIKKAKEGLEFPQFLLEMMLARETFLPRLYDMFLPVYQHFLLDVCHSMVSEVREETLNNSHLPVNALTFIAQKFKSESSYILETSEKLIDKIKPIEVCKLLEVVASASALTCYRKELQKDAGLLINCAFLLKSMHKIGQTGENNFTAVQKLSDLSTSTANSDIAEHPAFGFKSSLIRLLGNLCYKHKNNQDEVRELDCIPLLLDCCNIDARNPFIIQWVILAVRNLCDENLENQKVIASMTTQGVVDSAILQQIGLTLNVDESTGQKLVIMPLKK